MIPPGLDYNHQQYPPQSRLNPSLTRSQISHPHQKIHPEIEIMTRSSCLCGANIIEFTDAPVLKFKCHCMDERKLTGAAPFSLNWLVPDDTLKVVKGKLSEAVRHLKHPPSVSL
jgi:hypothetical protein